MNSALPRHLSSEDIVSLPFPLCVQRRNSQEEDAVPLPLELDQEVLTILGDDVAPVREVGPTLQKDIAARWSSILKNGLSNENRLPLLSKYPPAENCQLLEAPKLNVEVSAAVSESVVKRDQRLANLQTQVGASLAALGRTLSLMLEEEGGGNREYIRLISDAGRLLTDLHHSESSSRRDLVALNLNKDFKDTLNNATVDGWLFGDQLGERVKAAKIVERSGKDLKQPQQKTTRKSVGSSARTLNFRGPPRSAQGVRPGGRHQQQQRIQAYRYQFQSQQPRHRAQEQRIPATRNRSSVPDNRH